MELEFSAPIVYWRGPAPYWFLPVPEEAVAALREVAAAVTYGWGMIPVTVQAGRTRWTTSLFPKDGGYLVPIRAAVARAEHLDLGDVITVRLEVAT